MYPESQVGRMISRIELVEWATQEGYSVTADQIERWHKKGIIPAPVRCPTKGQTGSVWMYPDEAKHNLMLLFKAMHVSLRRC
jgi:hypothetical protein